MIDAYTKTVLSVIAGALLLLALRPFYATDLRDPSPGAPELEKIEGYVARIEWSLSNISLGRCTNETICAAREPARSRQD